MFEKEGNKIVINCIQGIFVKLMVFAPQFAKRRSQKMLTIMLCVLPICRCACQKLAPQSSTQMRTNQSSKEEAWTFKAHHRIGGASSA